MSGAPYIFQLESFKYLSDMIINKVGNGNRIRLRKVKEGKSNVKAN